jgi:hypothetical protein
MQLSISHNQEAISVGFLGNIFFGGGFRVFQKYIESNSIANMLRQ